MAAQTPPPTAKDVTTGPRKKPASVRAPQAALGRIARFMYPHGTHPALVPGISIDDQRVSYKIDKPILFTVGAIILTFVTWV